MIKFLFVFLVFSFAQVKAEYKLSDKLVLKPFTCSVREANTVCHVKKENVSQTKTKFIYAELVYQRLYGEGKLFVNASSLSAALKKSVAQKHFIKNTENFVCTCPLLTEPYGGVW